MQVDIHYKNWLKTIKNKIKSAQLKAAVTVNTQLLELYWDLVKEIFQKQKDANWGDAVLEQLSVDLKLAFPSIKGFSRRNLYAIKQWYGFYAKKSEFVPQAVAQIPWGSHKEELVIPNCGRSLKIINPKLYGKHSKCIFVNLNSILTKQI